MLRGNTSHVTGRGVSGPLLSHFIRPVFPFIHYVRFISFPSFFMSLVLTQKTHIHATQTPVPPAAFEPAIPGREPPTGLRRTPRGRRCRHYHNYDGKVS